jgi:putative tricarboxylic transport membrane protein
VDIEYLMLRGIFLPGEVPQEAVDYYVSLFQKVRETPEWHEFMAKGAFNTTFMTGDEFKGWLQKAADTHKDLMTKAGFIGG